MVIEFTSQSIVVSVATLWALYQAVCWVMDRYKIGKKRKDYHLLQKSNKLIMRQIIRNAHEEALAAGYIDEDELEHLEEVYALYKRLNGNGTGDRWMKEIRKLKKISDKN